MQRSNSNSTPPRPHPPEANLEGQLVGCLGDVALDHMGGGDGWNVDGGFLVYQQVVSLIINLGRGGKKEITITEINLRRACDTSFVIKRSCLISRRGTALSASSFHPSDYAASYMACEL